MFLRVEIQLMRTKLSWLETPFTWPHSRPKIKAGTDFASPLTCNLLRWDPKRCHSHTSLGTHPAQDPGIHLVFQLRPPDLHAVPRMNSQSGVNEPKTRRACEPCRLPTPPLYVSCCVQPTNLCGQAKEDKVSSREACLLVLYSS